MRVRKTVFSAARLGMRFTPGTRAQPNEMRLLVDKPMIQYGADPPSPQFCRISSLFPWSIVRGEPHTLLERSDLICTFPALSAFPGALLRLESCLLLGAA